MPNTDDTRIREIMELAPPSHLMREFPCTEVASRTAFEARQAIHRILHGMDDRLLVVIGPCSIHDTAAALEYARQLAVQRERFAGELEIVMRVYFEKPRTTVGWKGLINDPHLDGTFRIDAPDGHASSVERQPKTRVAGACGRDRSGGVGRTRSQNTSLGHVTRTFTLTRAASGAQVHRIDLSL